MFLNHDEARACKNPGDFIVQLIPALITDEFQPDLYDEVRACGLHVGAMSFDPTHEQYSIQDVHRVELPAGFYE